MVKFIEFATLGDERGKLVALEITMKKTVPFDVKRIYYIYNTVKGVSRGFHAHRELKQVAICLSGKCRMILNDGKTQEETWMCSPTKGLIIDSMVWHEMHDFSHDCILLVLASEHYDEADYIRNYEQFIREASV